MVTIAVAMDANDWALVHGCVAGMARHLSTTSPTISRDLSQLARGIDYQVYTAMGMEVPDFLDAADA